MICSIVNRSIAVAPIILFTVTSFRAVGQQKASPEKEAAMKADLAGQIDGMKKQAQVMVDSLYSYGELGFQEFETSKYLSGILEKEGFQVERGVAGIPTAFVATWGSGKPVIALGSDIDDIPQASQMPGVAYHDPMIEGAPGHGEGHNSGMPLQIMAALAVKKVMEREHLSGTLKLWPGVAEELLGSKAFLVKAGVFKDVDIVLFAHVGTDLSVAYGPTGGSGLVSLEYLFKGEAAHAAMAPWRGRSALDAVELMDVGWNFRREHLRLATRIHYVITNGGDQPNVVPPNAAVWYYYREADYDHIMNLWRIGENMAKAATLMTDTTYTSRILGTAWPGYFNKPIAEDMYANMLKVGLPAWSAEDETLAKALQKELKMPEEGLATKIGRLRPEISKAVVGNVSGLEKVTLEQLGKTLDRASRTMTALLGSIAAVSLLVGGIGIMNIMLLSVTERTREIGIRRAIGARGNDVLQQFLVEAVVLSAVGGLAGVIIGVIAAASISHMVQWTTAISPLSIAVSLGIATSVGVFFGFYPAREAARVLPIEALRYE